MSKTSVYPFCIMIIVAYLFGMLATMLMVNHATPKVVNPTMVAGYGGTRIVFLDWKEKSYVTNYSDGTMEFGCSIERAPRE